MESNKHELYQELLREIERANDDFLDAVHDLQNSHMRYVKEMLRTHLSIEEGSTTSNLLAQSIREQLEKPVTVVAPVAEETNAESVEENTTTLSALIANQVNEEKDESVQRTGRRPISSIIEELKRSVEHTIDEETDTATEEVISESLSASEDTSETESATVTDLAEKIKAELLAQQIKKQLQ